MLKFLITRKTIIFHHTGPGSYFTDIAGHASLYSGIPANELGVVFGVAIQEQHDGTLKLVPGEFGFSRNEMTRIGRFELPMAESIQFETFEGPVKQWVDMYARHSTALVLIIVQHVSFYSQK
jgi:hypothetical protein